MQDYNYYFKTKLISQHQAHQNGSSIFDHMMNMRPLLGLLLDVHVLIRKRSDGSEAIKWEQLLRGCGFIFRLKEVFVIKLL